jgi:hypothetical protein
MPRQSIKLVSPDSTAIVGALLEDGSTCSAAMTYDATISNIDIVIENNGESKLAEEEGELIYVDPESVFA